MILKITGICLVVVSTTLIGLEMSRALKRRVETIGHFISSLQYMENTIDFALLPLGEILQNLSLEAKGIAQDFFKDVSSMYNTYLNEGFAQIWSKELIKCKVLTKDEKDALQQLADQLGTSGKDAQIAIIQLCKTRLSHLLNQAQQDLQKRGNMFRSLGISLGLLIAIILI